MADEQEEKELPDSIKYSYSKNSNFRVIKADGVWGGATPRGEIVMSVFSERHPLPNFEEYKILEDGTLEKPPFNRHTESEGIMREVEVALSLHPDVAKTVADWLLSKLSELEKAGIIVKRQSDGEETQKG